MAEDVFEFTLAFGWSAPKIGAQLIALGISDVPEVRVVHMQQDADAILRCVRRGLITPSVAMKARNRMTRNIEKWLFGEGYIAVAENLEEKT